MYYIRELTIGDVFTLQNDAAEFWVVITTPYRIQGHFLVDCWGTRHRSYPFSTETYVMIKHPVELLKYEGAYPIICKQLGKEPVTDE